MIEPIDKALVLAGTDMTFCTFTIKGIVGFNLSMLYKGEQSLYGTEVQNFSVQCSTADIVANQVKKGDVFTMQDRAKEYKFKVSRPVDDLTGWTEIHCDYETSKEL